MSRMGTSLLNVLTESKHENFEASWLQVDYSMIRSLIQLTAQIGKAIPLRK